MNISEIEFIIFRDGMNCMHSVVFCDLVLNKEILLPSFLILRTLMIPVLAFICLLASVEMGKEEVVCLIIFVFYRFDSFS